FEFAEPISAVTAFKHHVVGEIVDDARRPVALLLCFDGCQSGCCSNRIEKIARCGKSRFWQHRKKFPRRIGRRCTSREAVSMDHRTGFVGVRAVDSELSRRARTEASDAMRYRHWVLWIAAAPFA